MESGAYAEMFELEDHHWWFRGRRRRMRPMLAEALAAAGPRPRVLEVGCGTGGNLEHLLTPHAAAHCIGADLDAGALVFCRKRGLRAELVRADGLRLPFATGSIDCLVASDIIEHFDDDAALVQELGRVLRPGGQLVASVPQYPALWSPHDEFLHHKRRYRIGQLEALLANSGFRIQRRLGFNFLLLPVIALVRRIKSARAADAKVGDDGGGTDFFPLPGPLNGAMSIVFALEAGIARLAPFPHGVSLLVRAERE